jgi:hypothetical protein
MRGEVFLYGLERPDVGYKIDGFRYCWPEMQTTRPCSIIVGNNTEIYDFVIVIHRAADVLL